MQICWSYHALRTDQIYEVESWGEVVGSPFMTHEYQNQVNWIGQISWYWVQITPPNTSILLLILFAEWLIYAKRFIPIYWSSLRLLILKMCFYFLLYLVILKLNKLLCNLLRNESCSVAKIATDALQLLLAYHWFSCPWPSKLG